MIVKTLELGPMSNRTYVVGNPDKGECLVIDPSWEMTAIAGCAKDNGWKIKDVFLTHGHFDHVKDMAALLTENGLRAHLEKNDAAMLEIKQELFETFSGDAMFVSAGLDVEILHTPGHSGGSCCIKIEDSIFTGDTLFIGECGRVDLPGSDPVRMWESLLRLAKLDAALKVYPGHSYSSESHSTIGREVLSNPYMVLAAKGRAQFIEAMS